MSGLKVLQSDVRIDLLITDVGLPGERVVDLDGIVDMAEHIAHISKEVTKHFAIFKVLNTGK